LLGLSLGKAGSAERLLQFGAGVSAQQKIMTSVSSLEWHFSHWKKGLLHKTDVCKNSQDEVQGDYFKTQYKGKNSSLPPKLAPESRLSQACPLCYCPQLEHLGK